MGGQVVDLAIPGLLGEEDDLLAAVGIARAGGHLPGGTEETAHVGVHEGDAEAAARDADRDRTVRLEPGALAFGRSEQFGQLRRDRGGLPRRTVRRQHLGGGPHRVRLRGLLRKRCGEYGFEARQIRRTRHIRAKKQVFRVGRAGGQGPDLAAVQTDRLNQIREVVLALRVVAAESPQITAQRAGAQGVERAVGFGEFVEALALHGIAHRVDVVLLQDPQDAAPAVAQDPAFAVLRRRLVDSGEQGQVRLAAAGRMGVEKAPEGGLGDDAVTHGDDQQRVVRFEAGNAQRLIGRPRRAAGGVGAADVHDVRAEARHHLLPRVSHQGDAGGLGALAAEGVEGVPGQGQAAHGLHAFRRGAEARAFACGEQDQNAPAGLEASAGGGDAGTGHGVGGQGHLFRQGGAGGGGGRLRSHDRDSVAFPGLRRHPCERFTCRTFCDPQAVPQGVRPQRLTRGVHACGRARAASGDSLSRSGFQMTASEEAGRGSAGSMIRAPMLQSR